MLIVFKSGKAQECSLDMCKVCPFEGEVGANNNYNTCAIEEGEPPNCNPCFDWMGS